jgi:hypothetical protein
MLNHPRIKVEPVTFFLDWMDHHLDLPEITFRRVSGHATMAEIFISLGNTATAFQRLWAGVATYANMSDRHKSPRIMDAANQEGIVALSQLRHPDASLIAKLEIKDPCLSMLGSWLKIPVKAPPSKIMHRYSCSSFIWKSKAFRFHNKTNIRIPFLQAICTLVADEKAGLDLSIATSGAST